MPHRKLHISYSMAHWKCHAVRTGYVLERALVMRQYIYADGIARLGIDKIFEFSYTLATSVKLREIDMGVIG